MQYNIKSGIRRTCWTCSLSQSCWARIFISCCGSPTSLQNQLPTSVCLSLPQWLHIHSLISCSLALSPLMNIYEVTSDFCVLWQQILSFLFSSRFCLYAANQCTGNGVIQIVKQELWVWKLTVCVFTQTWNWCWQLILIMQNKIKMWYIEDTVENEETEPGLKHTSAWGPIVMCTCVKGHQAKGKGF